MDRHLSASETFMFFATTSERSQETYWFTRAKPSKPWELFSNCNYNPTLYSVFIDLPYSVKIHLTHQHHVLVMIITNMQIVISWNRPKRLVDDLLKKFLWSNRIRNLSKVSLFLKLTFHFCDNRKFLPKVKERLFFENSRFVRQTVNLYIFSSTCAMCLSYM